MNFETFVALRYLPVGRRRAFISVISLVSVLGVGLGVAALIVVLGVMNGFSNDLRDKILGVNAHIIVSDASGLMGDYQGAVEKSRQAPGVVGVTPFIYSEVMLSSEYGVKGVILRGIDPDGAGEVLSILDDLVLGDEQGLKTDLPLPGVLVGEDLAGRLGLSVGSPVNLLAPTGRRTAAGFAPEVKTYMVSGVFSTGMYEYDTSLAFTSLDAARRLVGMSDDLVSGLELKVDDVYAADEIGDRVEKLLGGYPVYARDWMEMNANLFAALELEKTAMFIILVMIVLVGSFSIITTLVMLVMEKTKDIAVLMSMGARRKQIRNIFIRQGLIIGGVGASLGFAIGLTLCRLLAKYQFIKLPRDVYTLDHLPVQVDWVDLAIIGAATMAMCFLATLYPAAKAAGLKPAEALRYE